MWTLVLTATGLVGMWLIPRHWYGWILYLVNECLWLAYALEIRSHPLLVMSVLWGLVGIRNLKVARDLASTSHLQVVRPKVSGRARPYNGCTRCYLWRVLAWYSTDAVHALSQSVR